MPPKKHLPLKTHQTKTVFSVLTVEALLCWKHEAWARTE